MADLIRSAKSACDCKSQWTRADLDAYNISVVLEDAATFFGLPVLPQPQVDQELLVTEDAENVTADKNAELIHLLDLAMVPSSEDSAANHLNVER